MSLSEQKCESFAVLTLKGASDWSIEGKRAVAEWLRSQANALLKEGKEYSPRFRARYVAKVKNGTRSDHC